jgi:hypothetical protein
MHGAQFSRKPIKLVGRYLPFKKGFGCKFEFSLAADSRESDNCGL